MKRRGRFLLLLVLILGALGAAKNFYDLDDVRVTYGEAPKAVADAMRGMKIMFLSDIHVHEIGPREKFVLRLADEVRPDYIFISGDLMPYGGPIEPSIEFFKRLNPKKGGYAVLGDAEYKEGIRNCLYCHAPGSWAVRDDLPVKVLRDSVVTIEGADGAPVDLWGADAQPEGNDFSWARKAGDGRPVIAMSHFPFYFEQLAKEGADLVLAGDTHGGQAWGPKWYYRLLLGRKEAPYLKGRFTSGRSDMWVSRGLGWSIAPIRIGVKPEVIIFDLTRQAENP